MTESSFRRRAKTLCANFCVAALASTMLTGCFERFRTIDGTDNNPYDSELGASHTQLRRSVPSDYNDGVSSMAGQTRPSAREISNIVAAQQQSVLNGYNASDYLWQWGQFLDHDIDLSEGAVPLEPEPIVVPFADPHFDPFSTGGAVIEFNRSIHDTSTGTDPSNPRQQLNEITHWIDASNVYGSDEERANALRTNDGTGKLRTSAGDLLPFNDGGFPNAGGSAPTLFLAGDVRANEQVGLASLHTLFVREHNRIVDELTANHPHLDGDQLYERARKKVGALMQVITYEEFLPALLGSYAPGRYRGYRPWVDPRIRNIFSTAIYRFGHSALSSTLLRLDATGAEIAEGHLPLRDAFFAPERLTDEGGIEPVLRGLASQECQAVDGFVIDDVRNFLFGPPGAGGFDLASLNIQRGRDHGLPSYNATRTALGLGPKASMADISSDPAVQQALEQAYASVDDVDLWIGALCEDPLPGAHVGEVAAHVIRAQFDSLRTGDAYWWQWRTFGRARREIGNTRLSDIIRRNTGIDSEIQDDVFRVQ